MIRTEGRGGALYLVIIRSPEEGVRERGGILYRYLSCFFHALRYFFALSIIFRAFSRFLCFFVSSRVLSHLLWCACFFLPFRVSSSLFLQGCFVFVRDLRAFSYFSCFFRDFSASSRFSAFLRVLPGKRWRQNHNQAHSAQLTWVAWL